MAWDNVRHDRLRDHIRTLNREQRLLFLVEYARRHAIWVKENFDVVYDANGRKVKRRKH